MYYGARGSTWWAGGLLGTTLVSISNEVGVGVLVEVGVIDDFRAGVSDEFGVGGWGVGRPRDTKVEDGGIQRHSGVLGEVFTKFRWAPQLFPGGWPQAEVPLAFSLAV